MKARTIVMSTIAIGVVVLISTAVLLFFAVKSNVIETESKKEAVQNKTHKECVLDANKKYTETIKLFGTPMTIDGKKVDGLSTEEWQSIEDQRKSDVAECGKDSQ